MSKYKNGASAGEEDSSPVNSPQFATLDLSEIYANRACINAKSGYYQRKILSTETAIIRYMSEPQKESLRNELVESIAIIHQKYRLDRALKVSDVNDLKFCLERAVVLLNRLNGLQCEATALEASRSVTIFGIIKTILRDFWSRPVHEPSELVIELINKLNQVRLYWLWGDGIFRALIQFVANHWFFNTSALSLVTNTASRTGSYASFVFYFLRFALNAMLILVPLKYDSTFSNIQVSDGKYSVSEEQEDRNGRLKWRQGVGARAVSRLSSLANDGPWGPANLLTFLYFTGYVGYLINGAFFLYDIIATVVRWIAVTHSFNQQRQTLEAELTALKEKKGLFDSKENQQYNALLEMLSALNQEQKAANVSNCRDLLYSLAFFACSTVCFSFFLPASFFSAATASLFLIVAAAAGVAVAAIYYSSENILAIRDSLNELGDIKKEALKFQNNEFGTVDLYVLKFTHFNIQQLVNQARFHWHSIYFNLGQLVFTLVLLFAVPAAIFVSLLFAPLSLGIALATLTLTIAVATQVLLNAVKPVLSTLKDTDVIHECSLEDAFGEDSSNPLAKTRKQFFPNKTRENNTPNSDDDGDACDEVPLCP